MKLLQIGFNECGTPTKEWRSEHSFGDWGLLARWIFSNLAEGEELGSGYEVYQALGDMESVDSTRFIESWPNTQTASSFQIRDRERWTSSRLRHHNSYALDFFAGGQYRIFTRSIDVPRS